MNFIKLILKKKVSVTVLTIAIIIIGLTSLSQISVDYLPTITYPMIKIHIWWRGATPEEIETNVADPIESVLATVDNLDYLESSSIEGMYTLLVNFKYGINVDVAYQDVMAAMGRVMKRLPKGMDPPVIIKADPSQLPVMQLVLSSKTKSLVWLRDWAENWLADRITAIPGTAGTEIVGGLKREIRINLDIEKLQAYNLTVASLAKTLAESNEEMFAGRITVENTELIARTMGAYENVEEIKNLTVNILPTGQSVYLKDVAEVEDGHEEVRVITKFNGVPCVKINILKQSDANTVKVADNVKKQLDKILSNFSKDINFGYVENQGKYVIDAINSVKNSAILSAILVILVIYIFLGKWRQVVVMLIALPVTLLANFFLMKYMNFSINMFSMGGLVIALGVILDNSIVVLENITRLKNNNEPDFAYKGTTEVISSLITSSVTFLAILLPFLFVPGLTALLFKELILVIAGIILISLIVALTVTPSFTHRLLLTEKNNNGKISIFQKIINKTISIYSTMLQKVLHLRIIVIIIFVLILTAGFFAAKKAGSEFLPKLDDGRVMVKVKTPSGTSVKKLDGILAKIENTVKDMPGIESIFRLSGGKVWGLYTYEIANEGELDIQLVPKNKRKFSTKNFIGKVKKKIKKLKIPKAKIPVMQMKVKGIRKIGEQEVEVKVKGADIKKIFSTAKVIRKKLSESKKITNVNISMNMTKPEYRIYVDRIRASALGISVEKTAQTLKTLVNGFVATQYLDNGIYYNIRLIVPEKKINSKESLENLMIANKFGKLIYLKDFAEVKRQTGPVEIVREDQVKQIIVRSDAAAGFSIGESASEAKQILKKIELPEGVDYSFGGKVQMMKESNRTMIIIAVFAFMMGYVFLAIQFESYIMPFLILLMFPLSLIGAFFSLWIAGFALGSTVLVGLVVMMGCITSQGVLLITVAEQHFRLNKKGKKAVLYAAPLRIKAILMTQMTTVFGLIPLALNLGEGGDLLQPMAIAVIGGLLFSLLLTLFLLPVLYSFVRK